MAGGASRRQLVAEDLQQVGGFRGRGLRFRMQGEYGLSFKGAGRFRGVCIDVHTPSVPAQTHAHARATRVGGTCMALHHKHDTCMHMAHKASLAPNVKHKPARLDPKFQTLNPKP